MADPYPQNRALLQPHLPGALSQAAATRARLFEDEKKRVIQSCFSRVDDDGVLMESYITHCKVVEDAASPSAPPPPGGPIEQKKTRVIIVAVRSTGRVRMHKARENPNGLFQIGKTWNLDDLSAIENHAAPHEKGFTVTIIKPYYWQASSSKEKDFFISAVLKIYKKYTGGRIPRLVRFEGTEIDRMLDGAASLQAKQRAEVGRREGEEQIEEDRRPSPVSPFPTPKPTPLRNLTSAVSMDNLAKSPGRQPPLRAKGIDGLRVGPGALRPSQSSDQLPNRRPPDPNPQLQPRAIPGNPAYTPASGTTLPTEPPPPPIPPQGPGRRPSDGSSKLGRDSPGIRGASAEDERGLRRTPSNEILRTTSASSHQSREAMEQYHPHSGSRGLPSGPSPVPSTESRSPLKKKSSKDVASHFRLAANTYAAGGLMVDRRARPETPTTPSSTMSKASPQDQERQNELPQIKYPMERRERDAGGGSGPYGTAGDVAGSVGEDRRIKARDPPAMPMSSQRPPAQAEKQMELPPRSDARGGTIPSKDNSRPMFPLPTPTTPRAASPNHQLKRESLDVPRASERRPGSPDRAGPGPDNEQTAGRSRSPNTRTRKRKSIKSSYLDEVDTSRVTVDIEELLREFNWDPQGKVDALEAKIKKEIADVEAGNVIVNTDGDARIQELSNLLDKAIEECDGMDALLTLYAVELTSLNDDIAHIENQSQGLQVQTANQKTLQRELQNLMSVISIMPQQLEVLKYGSLDSPQGLQSIEETLLALYKAMVTIDPKVARNAPESPVGLERRGSWSDGGVGSMRALQEKKEGYQTDTRSFMARMRQFMSIRFGAEVVELGKNSKNQYSSGAHPKLVGHDSAYVTLCRFSGLVAFARDVDLEEYLELQKIYERPVSQLFQDEFRDHTLAWKRIAKRPLQDELDLLFTAQEKETDNVAVTAARKLTVKRSQTLAKIRSPTAGQFKDKNQDGLINPNEAFAGALSEIYRLVLREQNFLVEFFQMSSQSPQDFIEFVAKSPPVEQRRFQDLGGLKPAELDKGKARMVFEFLTALFSFLPQDLQNFVEWSIKTDPLQSVGVLYSIEEKIATLEVTDQEFMLKTLQKLQARLAGLFSRFLDDQVKAIEDTKVKIKKRKGVIPFMKVFPAFASKVEEQLPVEVVGNDDELDIRDMINEGYERINKAMFESLHAIAKESPTVASQSVDPEDKEQLNYHVMMIENMHHYLEEVYTRGNSVLEVFKKKAERDFTEHVELYVGAVIRRPLGKLLDFVESVEVLQRAGADDISSRQSHNKQAFKKVLGHHDSKEIRRGIETLRKRVDKHFADSDDAALCARLLEKLSNCLEKEYIEAHRRVQKLLLTVYKDSGLEMEFLVADIIGAFKK